MSFQSCWKKPGDWGAPPAPVPELDLYFSKPVVALAGTEQVPPFSGAVVGATVEQGMSALAVMPMTRQKCRSVGIALTTWPVKTSLLRVGSAALLLGSAGLDSGLAQEPDS